MFYAYHALKAKINSEFDACIPDIDKTPFWIYFAQSFSAEAGELGLSTTLFDPASFSFVFKAPCTIDSRERLIRRAKHTFF